MVKRHKIKVSYQTDCFNYGYTRIDGQLGWQLEAREGKIKFRCKAFEKGLPVISLENAFMHYPYNKIDISEMETSNVRYMTRAFAYANVKNLDLSSFNFENVYTMDDAFFGSTIQSITFGDEKDTYRLRYLRELFSNCIDLEYIDMSGLKFAKNETLFCAQIFGFTNVKKLEAAHLYLPSGVYLGTTFDKLEHIILPNTIINKSIMQDLGLDIVESTIDKIDTLKQKLSLLDIKRVAILLNNT